MTLTFAIEVIALYVFVAFFAGALVSSLKISAVR